MCIRDRGRIWSGEKALKLGLVDKIGDLDDAIKSAASFADLDDYKIVTYSKEMDPFEIFLSELIDNFGGKLKLSNEARVFSRIVNSQYKFINPDKKINTAIYCFECDYFNTK